MQIFVNAVSLSLHVEVAVTYCLIIVRRLQHPEVLVPTLSSSILFALSVCIERGRATSVCGCRSSSRLCEYPFACSAYGDLRVRRVAQTTTSRSTISCLLAVLSVMALHVDGMYRARASDMLEQAGRDADLRQDCKFVLAC